MTKVKRHEQIQKTINTLNATEEKLQKKLDRLSDAGKTDEILSTKVGELWAAQKTLTRDLECRHEGERFAWFSDGELYFQYKVLGAELLGFEIWFKAMMEGV